MLPPLSCNHLCSQGPWAPKHTWGETDSKPGAVTPWSIPPWARVNFSHFSSSFFFVNNGDGDHNLMEANGSKEESEKGKLLPRPLFPVSFWGNLQGLGERTGFLIIVTVGSWGWHSMIIFQEYYILCSYWKHSHFPTPFLTHHIKWYSHSSWCEGSHIVAMSLSLRPVRLNTSDRFCHLSSALFLGEYPSKIVVGRTAGGVLLPGQLNPLITTQKLYQSKHCLAHYI